MAPPPQGETIFVIYQSKVGLSLFKSAEFQTPYMMKIIKLNLIVNDLEEFLKKKSTDEKIFAIYSLKLGLSLVKNTEFKIPTRNGKSLRIFAFA